MARPTLQDVAASAGVSLASASRALSGGSASAQVVRRVTRAALDLGYLPHATARALRSGTTQRVAFAVDDIGNPNYVAMLRAIEERLGAEGPYVSVSALRDLSRTTEWVRQLAAGGADGLIMSPIRSDERLRDAIASSTIPTVVVGSLGEGIDVDSVRVDSSVGVGLAVAHVREIGRRRIVFLNGPLDTRPGGTREQGFFRAVRRLGIPRDTVRQVVAEDFTVEAGRVAAAHLYADWHRLRPVDRPDAVVAANDLIAVGAIVAATAAGLRVPQDVAVTGIDDTEYAAMYNPSLTSVSLFASRRGELAADLLLQRFADPSRPVQTIDVVPELVVRNSTRPQPVAGRVG